MKQKKRNEDQQELRELLQIRVYCNKDFKILIDRAIEKVKAKIKKALKETPK